MDGGVELVVTRFRTGECRIVASLVEPWSLTLAAAVLERGAVALMRRSARLQYVIPCECDRIMASLVLGQREAVRNSRGLARRKGSSTR